MQRLFVALISLAFTFGGFAARAAGDARAAELLAQARAALGGEGKLAQVSGLSATGTFTREMGDRQLSGEMTIDLQLPDKLLRTESMSPMGDATITTEQGINGERLLRHTSVMGGGPNIVIRTPPPPAAGTEAETQALRNSRADLARTALMFLVTAPATLPLEFTYGGEAASDDGKADVVDAKGPGSFAAKIFLDRNHHRPLMLAYRGVAPRMVIQTQHGGPDSGEVQRAGRGAAPAEPPAPQAVDITLFLDDYRTEGGVMLPHHVSRSIDGKTTEEWTLKTIAVNPAFKPDTFSAK